MEVYVTINGKAMSKKEYIAYKKSKNQSLFEALPKSKQAAIKREKKAKANKPNAYNELTSEIECMVNGVKVMGSLSAYHRNGFRMWGTIHSDIINEPNISVPYNKYLRQEREISALVDEIAGIRGRSVFAFIRLLSWKLQDVSTTIEELRNGVSASGVISRNFSHECIIGEGKRLGLRILLSRTYDAVKVLNKLSNEFLKIADNELV